jgi:hypothetical protein
VTNRCRWFPSHLKSRGTERKKLARGQLARMRSPLSSRDAVSGGVKHSYDTDLSQRKLAARMYLRGIIIHTVVEQYSRSSKRSQCVGGNRVRRGDVIRHTTPCAPAYGGHHVPSTSACWTSGFSSRRYVLLRPQSYDTHHNYGPINESTVELYVIGQPNHPWRRRSHRPLYDALSQRPSRLPNLRSVSPTYSILWASSSRFSSVISPRTLALLLCMVHTFFFLSSLPFSSTVARTGNVYGTWSRTEKPSLFQDICVHLVRHAFKSFPLAVDRGRILGGGSRGIGRG